MKIPNEREPLFEGLLTPAREARNRTRTDDPFLTMEVLYQLSYPGRFGSIKPKIRFLK
jgi:hypothetical protein